METNNSIPAYFSIETWNWIKSKMEVVTQLDTARLKGDLDEKQTAKLRGRIQAFEHFINGLDKTLKPESK